MQTEGPNRFSYNAQAVVDAKKQIVLAAEVTTQANDSAQLMPMLEAAQANSDQQPAQCTLADSGYSTAAQIAQAQEAGLEVLSPLPARVEGQDQPYHSSQFHYEPDTDTVRCPQGQSLKFHHQRHRSGLKVRVYRNHKACARCPVRGLCTTDRHGRSIDLGPHAQALARHRQKMRDPRHRELLKQRATIVEPVFGCLKEHGGFRRFSFRGRQKVTRQWQLLCAVWNLRKIHQASRQQHSPNPLTQALKSLFGCLANTFWSPRGSPGTP